jgi:hypothetical protein
MVIRGARRVGKRIVAQFHYLRANNIHTQGQQFPVLGGTDSDLIFQFFERGFKGGDIIGGRRSGNGGIVHIFQRVDNFLDGKNIRSYLLFLFNLLRQFPGTAGLNNSLLFFQCDKITIKALALLDKQFPESLENRHTLGKLVRAYRAGRRLFFLQPP